MPVHTDPDQRAERATQRPCTRGSRKNVSWFHLACAVGPVCRGSSSGFNVNEYMKMSSTGGSQEVLHLPQVHGRGCKCFTLDTVKITILSLTRSS